MRSIEDRGIFEKRRAEIFGAWFQVIAKRFDGSVVEDPIKEVFNIEEVILRNSKFIAEFGGICENKAEFGANLSIFIAKPEGFGERVKTEKVINAGLIEEGANKWANSMLEANPLREIK